MKRNYLYVIAVLFVICMTFVVVGTHAFDEPKRSPVFAPQKVERKLPRLPKMHG